MRKLCVAAGIVLTVAIGAPRALAQGPPSSPPGNSNSATDPGQGGHGCRGLDHADDHTDAAGVGLAEAIHGCGARG